MAQITIPDSSTGTKQGWYSTSSSSGNSGHTITMIFDNKTMTDFAATINNITINSAKLHLSCSKSGADRKKKFRLKMYGGTTLAYDYGTEKYSDEYAYNDSDVPITLTAASVKKWLSTAGTKKITSIDPQTGLHFGSGPWYSYNYVKVTNSWLVIDYTVNSSQATFSSTTMTLGKAYDITINAGLDSYTHDIILKINDVNCWRLTGVKGGKHSITIPADEVGSQFPNKTSVQGVIEVITYNGTTAFTPSKTYNVTIATSSEHKPTIGEIVQNDITFSGVPNTEIPSDYAFALSEQTTITFSNYKNNAKAVAGATIKSYTIKIGDETFSDIIDDSYSFTAPKRSSLEKCIIQIAAKDSRGYLSDYTSADFGFFISPYSSPNIKINSFYRSNSANQRDDVSGTYAILNYTSNYPFKVYDAWKGSSKSFEVTCLVNAQTEYEPDKTHDFQDIKTGQYFGKDKEGKGLLFAEKTYSFDFNVIDSLGYSKLLQKNELSSSAFLLHFRKKQNSIGIGCTAIDLSEPDTGYEGYQGLILTKWPLVIGDKLIINGGLQVGQGGTGVTSEKSLREKISLLLSNSGSSEQAIVSSIEQDTVDTWQKQGLISHYFNKSVINGQPTSYGILLNTTNQASVFGQLWFTTAGHLYARGSNENGISNWNQILDSSNYTDFVNITYSTTKPENGTGKPGQICLVPVS